MYFVYQAPTTSTMALWLKAEKYSVPDVNNLPTVYSAISIVFMIVSGAYNDWRGSQVESIILICMSQIISESMLTAWTISKPAKFFAYYIAGTIQSLFPIIVSWAHIVCSGDAEERAIVIGSLNAIGLAQGTWWNQVSIHRYVSPIDSKPLIRWIGLYSYRRGAPLLPRLQSWPCCLIGIVCVVACCDVVHTPAAKAGRGGNASRRERRRGLGDKRRQGGKHFGPWPAQDGQCDRTPRKGRRDWNRDVRGYTSTWMERNLWLGAKPPMPRKNEIGQVFEHHNTESAFIWDAIHRRNTKGIGRSNE